MTGKELAELLKKKAAEVVGLENVQGFAFILVPTGAIPIPVGIVVTEQSTSAEVFVRHVSAAMEVAGSVGGSAIGTDFGGGFRGRS